MSIGALHRYLALTKGQGLMDFGMHQRDTICLQRGSQDITDVIPFGSQVIFVSLAAMEYVVIQRDKNG